MFLGFLFPRRYQQYFLKNLELPQLKNKKQEKQINLININTNSAIM